MKPRIALLALAVVFASTVLMAADGSSKGVVNINTATEEQLQLLPRVGPALAKRIVEFRENNGQFKAPEEILAVKGIGERSFENLRPYLATKGETSLKEKVRLPRARKSGQENAAGSSS
jgi:competence protein ComEA